jgi:uroporphyrinogen III methyltransferase/synthase
VCAPAIFVLGEVVNLQKWLHWFDDKPLFGVRVMVTRPADQAQEMYNSLRGFGAEVLAYPTIATSEHVDPPAWLAYEKITTAKRWLVFTSENGVRYFMKQFLSKRRDIRTLQPFKIAAVGDGTSKALTKYHLTPDFVPTEATTGALTDQLAAHDSWESATAVRARGNRSDENIEMRLQEAGAEVIPMTVYQTYFPQWPEGFKEKLFEYPPDVVTFTSGSSVEGLFANLSNNEVKEIIEGATLLSIGPSASNAAAAHGLSVTIEAKQHSIASMIDELMRYAQLHPLRRSA